jgi:hypothetical protein
LPPPCFVFEKLSYIGFEIKIKGDLNPTNRGECRKSHTIVGPTKINQLIMEKMNLHKQKLYALIVAAIGVISCILPWWKVSYGGGGFGGMSVSINGFMNWDGSPSLVSLLLV